MILNFYKDKDGWFIDYPSFPGSKSHLEMVSGADKWLDYFNKGTNKVSLDVFTEPSDIIHYDDVLVRYKSTIFGGAYYTSDSNIVDSLWLCPVTLFVMGKYPKVIAVNVI